ncbi:endonuclease Q family protein [Candidatus Harpocratesius sp.]
MILLPFYNSDLHLHSPYSIAVSKNISLETLNQTAQIKGIDILGTGDITQPNWRNYMRENLKKTDGAWRFKKTAFILQTELEDSESIHHLILLPDFSSVDVLIEKIRPYVKNIDGRWAGRPHVHRTPQELVEIVSDVNGLIGPAHAFTPFKSIFRQGKFNSLKKAYGTAVKKLAFLELGLSADTYLADRMEELQNITFLSNSDAHSEGLDAVGRELNRFSIEEPTFNELEKALLRKGNRKIILNLGLDPRLGKYYQMFCSKCRRRVLRSIQNKIKNKKIIDNKQEISKYLNIFGFPLKSWDDTFLYYEFPTKQREQQFLKLVAKKKIECEACRKIILKDPKRKKNSKIPHLQLGVSERINDLATWDSPHHPDHRPPYLRMIPLIELLAKIFKIKTLKSKTLNQHYQTLVSKYGNEFHIVVDLDLENVKKNLNTSKYEQMFNTIQAFRNNNITITPGGGGKFGEIKL